MGGYKLVESQLGQREVEVVVISKWIGLPALSCVGGLSSPCQIGYFCTSNAEAEKIPEINRYIILSVVDWEIGDLPSLMQTSL